VYTLDLPLGTLNMSLEGTLYPSLMETQGLTSILDTLDLLQLQDTQDLSLVDIQDLTNLGYIKGLHLNPLTSTLEVLDTGTPSFNQNFRTPIQLPATTKLPTSAPTSLRIRFTTDKRRTTTTGLNTSTTCTASPNQDGRLLSRGHRAIVRQTIPAKVKSLTSKDKKTVSERYSHIPSHTVPLFEPPALSRRRRGDLPKWWRGT